MKKIFLTTILVFAFFLIIKPTAYAACYSGRYASTCSSTNPSCGYCLTGGCVPYAAGGTGPWCTPVCSTSRTHACSFTCSPCGNSKWCPAPPVTTPTQTPTIIPQTDFNGVILDDNNNRWTPGSNCNQHNGVSITSSKGVVDWVTNDGAGGHFDVNSVPANQSVIVALTPSDTCNYECNTWSLTDGSDSGTGCIATFTATAPSWSRNVYFTMKPKCTASCSAPYCGQSDSCTGFCSSVDSGAPSTTSIVSPNGTASNPTIYTGSSNITFTWLKSTDTLTDGYRFAVWDSNNNQVILPTDISGVNSTTYTTIPDGFVPGRLYYWKVATFNNTCNGINSHTVDYSAWSTAGYFKINSPPGPGTVIIKNVNDNPVASENVPGVGTQVNQICDSNFLSSRTVKFTVTATDPDSVNDISSIQLRLGGTRVYSSDGPVVSGQANFTVSDLPDSTTLYTIETLVTDKLGSNSGWQASPRLLKMWNCLVPVIGTIYDGSSEPFGPTCNASSFATTIKNTTNYDLIFHSGATNKTMDVSSPNYSSNSSNHLTWGYTYNTTITMTGIPSLMKTTDLGDRSAGEVCPNDNLNLVLNSSHVNPYSTNPSIRADISSIMDQENWYQVSGGGINSVRGISDIVPITCQSPDCIPAIDINNDLISTENNGLLISGSIEKGCESCKYGSPDDTYVIAARNSLSENYNYQYFYNQYTGNRLSGKLYNGSTNFSEIVSDLGGTGIALVDGNVNVNSNNTLEDGKFLMVISRYDIIINPTVDHVEGVFVANGKITATDQSDTQLVINGVLYSAYDTVTLSRSHITKSLNNSKPPVLVNYRPDFVFYMPGQLVSMFSYWKPGI